MGAVIRQQYTHPVSEHRHVREMHLDIEIVRPDDQNDISSELSLRVDPWHNQPHPPPDCHFSTVFVDPKELISALLDGKRTSAPVGCMRTYLTEKVSKGSHAIRVFNNGENGLNARPGDPIVILSDLKGSNRAYALVESIDGDDTLNLVLSTEGLPAQFYVGALVQNLANRWHRATPVGAKSQLKRPQAVPFWMQPADNGIDLAIADPMSPGIIKYYDVYVRDRNFNNIEAHWVADATDIPTGSDNVILTTFNGGPNAGGGELKAGTYYVALISKDREGRVDVNESVVSTIVFELN